MRTATGPATSLRAAATRLFQAASPEGRAVAGTRRPSGAAALTRDIFVKRFEMQNLKACGREDGTKQVADSVSASRLKTQSGFWGELCGAKSFVVRAYYFSTL